MMNKDYYEKMTIKNLKDVLTNKDLKVSGNKKELIERLYSYETQNPHHKNDRSYDIVKLQPTLLYIKYGKINTHGHNDNYYIFDLDGTIIETKSGKRFPIDLNDWIFRDNVLNRLQNVKGTIKDNSTHLYIITNQAGISKGHITENDIIEKMKDILYNMNVSCEVYISEADDYWRKPNTSIFEHYIFDEYFPPKEVLYVGDAAGRDADFSDSDRKFAYNLDLFLKSKRIISKITFLTPELYFLYHRNVKSSFDKYSGVNPDHMLSKSKTYNMNDIFDIKIKYMVIMVGAPGSGKSYIAHQIEEYLPDSIIISQDTLKTKAKTIKTAKTVFKSSIIIDNTNPAEKDRQTWINIARERSLVPIIINVTTTIEESRHLNTTRERILGHKNFSSNMSISYKKVPEIVYRIYKKKYEIPIDNSDVFVINIYPNFQFSDNYSELFFRQLSI